MSGTSGGRHNNRASGQSRNNGNTDSSGQAQPQTTASTSSNNITITSNLALSAAPANSATASTPTITRPPSSNVFQVSQSTSTSTASASNPFLSPQSGAVSTSTTPNPQSKPATFPFTAGTSLFNTPNPAVRRRFDLAPQYGQSMLTVLVGSENNGISFSLHEQLARKKSGFIDAAFRNEWKESANRAITLPDHDPEHFQLFFLWIYNRQIFSAKEDDAPKGETDKEWDRLAHAWTLGAYLQAPDFRDAITDAIIEKLAASFKFGQSMNEIIYPSPDASAPIRKLIVDIAAWRWDQVVLKAQRHDAAWSEFFFDLSVAQMSNRKSNSSSTLPPWVKNPCAYHEHLNKKSDCYKSERK